MNLRPLPLSPLDSNLGFCAAVPWTEGFRKGLSPETHLVWALMVSGLSWRWNASLTSWSYILSWCQSASHLWIYRGALWPRKSTLLLWVWMGTKPQGDQGIFSRL